MVLKRLYKRYKQFGGFRLIRKYIQLGMFSEFLKQGVLVLLRKRPIDEAYSIIQSLAVPHLRSQYHQTLKCLVDKYPANDLEHARSGFIWFCWLQGLDNAPEVVKICYNSLLRNLGNRDIVVLSEDNIADYVSLPKFVIEKYHNGIIPMAHFTDLVRLELLIKYGGTWIDATVLCTGNMIENEIFNTDLFFFQHLKKGDERFHGISNWFISSCSNQRVLLVLRDLLYQYWKDYDCLIAYYIFHIFFSMIEEQIPDEISRMPNVSNKLCFYLENRLADKYDNRWMQELTKRCDFHKLSCRLWKEAENKEDSFLEYLRANYSSN